MLEAVWMIGAQIFQPVRPGPAGDDSFWAMRRQTRTTAIGAHNRPTAFGPIAGWRLSAVDP